MVVTNRVRRASFVTCVNDDDVYRNDVLKTTEGYADRIEYIRVDNPVSAPVGLNEGIRKASENIVVCCHQDIYFLNNWLDKMFEQLDTIPKWGVCGLAGAKDDGSPIGCHSGLGMEHHPIRVQTLDCSLIIVDKRNVLRFDENLEFFHMYGEDIALQANDVGLGAYVIYAPIIHHSKWAHPQGFRECVEYIQRKWRGKVAVIHTTVGTY